MDQICRNLPPPPRPSLNALLKVAGIENSGATIHTKNSPL